MNPDNRATVPWDLPTDRQRRIETVTARATDAIMKLQRGQALALVRSEVRTVVLDAVNNAVGPEPDKKPPTRGQRLAMAGTLTTVAVLFIACIGVPVSGWIYFNGILPLYEWAFPWL